MSHPDALADRLGAYALGLRDADPDGALAAHLAAGCDDCAGELRELRETSALLALGTEPLTPPDDLRGRLLDRVTGESFVFVLSGSGQWRQEGELEIKQLFSSPAGGGTELISLRTGSTLKRAYRPGHLGYVIIRGELDGEGLR
ncbi:MAG TPA: hypothetical protein VFB61_02320, partial [Gemmatimonadales bacterium]|nr:hypothetical protein [Gemmatimonadales bacterium]